MHPPTDMSSIHPIVKRAAKGKLPGWAEVDERRYAHMERVAALLDAWAGASGLPRDEHRRWVALGFLHDALKCLPPKKLRPMCKKKHRHYPGPVLHGPAAAALLAEEGVTDERLLRAITFHTIGHPGFDDAGKALYAADFLEPGRNMRNKWREKLRARMPAELDAVTREIIAARIKHTLKRGRLVQPETLDFWNSMVSGGRWARASEA